MGFIVTRYRLLIFLFFIHYNANSHLIHSSHRFPDLFKTDRDEGAKTRVSEGTQTSSLPIKPGHDWRSSDAFMAGDASSETQRENLAWKDSVDRRLRDLEMGSRSFPEEQAEPEVKREIDTCSGEIKRLTGEVIHVRRELEAAKTELKDVKNALTTINSDREAQKDKHMTAHGTQESITNPISHVTDDDLKAFKDGHGELKTKLDHQDQTILNLNKTKGNGVVELNKELYNQVSSEQEASTKLHVRMDHLIHDTIFENLKVAIDSQYIKSTASPTKRRRRRDAIGALATVITSFLSELRQYNKTIQDEKTELMRMLQDVTGNVVVKLEKCQTDVRTLAQNLAKTETVLDLLQVDLKEEKRFVRNQFDNFNSSTNAQIDEIKDDVDTLKMLHNYTRCQTDVRTLAQNLAKTETVIDLLQVDLREEKRFVRSHFDAVKDSLNSFINQRDLLETNLNETTVTLTSVSDELSNVMVAVDSVNTSIWTFRDNYNSSTNAQIDEIKDDVDTLKMLHHYTKCQTDIRTSAQNLAKTEKVLDLLQVDLREEKIFVRSHFDAVKDSLNSFINQRDLLETNLIETTDTLTSVSDELSNVMMAVDSVNTSIWTFRDNYNSNTNAQIDEIKDDVDTLKMLHHCEAAAAASSPGGLCPNTYTWHCPLSFCFRISTDYFTWTAAQDRCVSEGGHLLDAKDVDEHNHVKGFLTSGRYFVGGRDNVTEDSWYWTDGSPFTYAPWHPGQPNNYGVGQDCLAFEYDFNFDFSDRHCGHAHKYICEVDVNCLYPYTYEPSVGLCYRLGTELYNWQTANDQCTSEGGHLIDLKTAAIHTFIKSVCTTAGRHDYYIGGKDDIVEGTFRWTDGTLMDYASWGHGQPNDHDDQDCIIVETRYGYDMTDISCTRAFKYICEI